MTASKQTPRTVSQLRPAPYNPRAITDDELGMLAGAMVEFGDLGGIVFNIRSENVGSPGTELEFAL